MGEETGEKTKIHCLAHMFYHLMSFFAHWFGAARFDMDGDGDFDPEDVQAWLAKHHILGKKYKVPPKAKGGMSSSKSTGSQSSTTALARPAPAAQVGGASNAQPAEQREHHGPSSWLDRDGDGHVNVMDLVQTQVDGEAEEEIAMKKLATGQVVPFFVIIECTLCVGLWVIFSFVKGGDSFFSTKAGLDSLFDEQTDLRFYGNECEDLRWQFWRWITYQFTHVGIVHVMMNVFLNLILGLPLEGAEGHLRMFVMFQAGVFGGACANMILDGYNVVVGCSGGCYSLIGIHTADLLMNWGQKKFRLPTLFMIILLVSVDFGFGAASSKGDEHVSHTAHIGGAAAGLLIGVLVGKNLKMMAWEKCFYVTAGFLSLFFTVFSLAWLFTRTNGHQHIFDAAAGEQHWCWYRQVADPNFLDGAAYCVRCGLEECVEQFKNFQAIVRPEYEDCEKLGWLDHGY